MALQCKWNITLGLKIMKNIIYILVLILLYSCKTKNKENTTIQEESIPLKQEVEQQVEYRYVTAKSGLNYRKEPNGEVIGKFNYGEKLQIEEHTNVFENINDDNIAITGEWLGIKVKNEMYYTFGAYLKSKKEFDVFNNDISNLIPSGYEVEYQAKGDLNEDTIDDIAVVIKSKVNFEGDREVLIFFKEEDHYKIDKVSKTVFPNKFFLEDIETYFGEEITISNNELTISLYGTGPVGNNISTFKYFGEKLLLIDIETYNVGAGSHQSLNYDVLKGVLTQEITNTMKEDMPTEIKTISVGRKEYQFENASPDDIIIEVYNTI